ncbi:Cys/Met metabolism PLP-dependent enzyme-domain-containing protein [Chytridium lagenaria]|nr:Cys/Met metabolism PLP-dependent enzyme-domain-containing protein [Chytridium lagenaria]
MASSHLSSPLTPFSVEQPVRRPKKYSPATDCVFVSNTGIREPYGASAVPIYQTATFKQTSASEMGDYDYTRSGNPTRTSLETHLAKIMGASRAFATSTGMSAFDMITRLVKNGEEIIAGMIFMEVRTNRLLALLERTNGVVVHHVNTTQVSCVEKVLNERTRMVLLESPTNPLIKIADIPGIVAAVRRIVPNALVVVDNTMMSPLLLKTLELGADIEYHSGVIGVRSPDVAQQIAFVINATGSGLAPLTGFLLLRGIKTLSLRVERQQQNAQRIAEHLESRGLRVAYPGLKSHPGRNLHLSMAKGAGAVLSLPLEGTQLWGISVSFGCVNSLISMPCAMSHASIPAHVRQERNLPEDLIRLCVGIEDCDDLLEDLEASLVAAGL